MSAAKILFAGTPEFALVSLQALFDAGYVPAAVLTQPDRPSGRGKKMTESPVKLFARENEIPVWQPETLKDSGIVAQIAANTPVPRRHVISGSTPNWCASRGNHGCSGI